MGSRAERTVGSGRHDGLRVAVLTPSYWPEVRRGGERVVHELVTGLAARGHRPRIITAHPGRTTTTLEDGVEVIRRRRPPDGRLARRRFEEHLTHVPLPYRPLAAEEDALAHAVHVTDGLAAARCRVARAARRCSPTWG